VVVEEGEYLGRAQPARFLPRPAVAVDLVHAPG
jgi:hypothetical protein